MESQTDRPWVEIAQNELFEGWQRWTSFACIWVWSCLAGILSFQNSGIRSLPSVFGYANGITLAACVIGLAFVLAFSSRIKTAIDSRAYLGIAEALAVLGSLFISAGVLAGSSLCHVAGAGLGGIAIGLLKIAWGQMYSRMTLKAGLASMGYSLISSSVIVLLVQNADTLVLSILLIASALPLAPLAFRGTKRLADLPEKPRHSSRSVKFTASLLALPMLVGFSYGVSKAAIVGLIGNEASIGSAGTYSSLVAGVATFVFSYALGKKVSSAQIYSTSLVFVVAGLLLIMSNATSPWLSFFVNSIGFSLFYFFMVVYWGDLAWRTGMSIVRVYTIGYLTMQASQLAGIVIAGMLGENPLQNNGMLVILSLVLAFFAVVLLLFGSSRSSLRQWLIADGTALEVDDGVPVACAELSRQGNLSPREQEVLTILARGRNASYVAKTLCISPDTAKTHIKSIYRKLDVHTQQDLMDEIDLHVSSGDNNA